MLSGKAISRATGRHLLIYGVLYGIIVSDIYNCPILIEDSASDTKGEPLLDCNGSTLNMLSELCEEVIKGEIEVAEVSRRPLITEMSESISEYGNKLSKSRTAMLWFQYVDMVEILAMFIQAERKGSFLLHLHAVQKMSPYFAEAGHHLYTKSAYMYHQSMYKLETTNQNVY